MLSKTKRPLTDAELEVYESQRDLAEDLMQAIKEMKAGQVNVAQKSAVV